MYGRPAKQEGKLAEPVVEPAGEVRMASMGRISTVAFLLLFAVVRAQAALVVKNLHVEHRSTPLGIDVQQPRFGWQMEATAGERGAVRLSDRSA